MESSTLPKAEVSVTLGVDTHKDAHVAVALDGIGRHRGALSVPATITGYRRLLGWARGFGLVEKAGVDGTGSFGAGLARFLRAEGVEVFEVIRPKRRDQYRAGKSDPIDAEVAARALLAGTATGVSKGADGEVEMMRALRTTRRSALKARTQAANQMRALLITAPEQLRAEMREPSMDKLVVRGRHASGLARAPMTLPQRPSSRCARWPGATGNSRRRSPNSVSSWIGWWLKLRRNWSPSRAWAPIPPRP
jgi:transposase